jgi:hypothetical protein
MTFFLVFLAHPPLSSLSYTVIMHTKQWLSSHPVNEDDTPLGDLVLRAALARFPSSPSLLLLDAAFKTYVKKDLQTGYAAAEAARKTAQRLWDR